MPLLLVMGIGSQLVAWPDEFIQAFVERGFEVIVYDHRDVGLSTRMNGAPVPDPRMIIGRGLLKLPIDAPYLLEDMADDALAVMRAAGHSRFHVFGVSLGGMVAQVLAIRHPEAVESLVSVMSTTGDRRHAIGDPRAIAALLRPPPRTRTEAGQGAVEFFRAVGSRAYAQDEAGVRERGMLAYDRGISPAGFCRHLAAMVATGTRRAGLRRLRVPTLVIHGQDDPLIPHRGGLATAALVPGAEFMSVPGMGHDLPPAIQGRIAEAVEALARRTAGWVPTLQSARAQASTRS